MTSSIKQLLTLGAIPADAEMSDELFEKYDKLLNFSQPLSFEDAASIAGLFRRTATGSTGRFSAHWRTPATPPRNSWRWRINAAARNTLNFCAAGRRTNNQINSAGAVIFQQPGILILRRFSSII